MVCARGGVCVHVAPSEGCMCFWCPGSVCAHVVGCRGLPVSLGFAVCVSVDERFVRTCAACLGGMRFFGVCSAGLGAVHVLSCLWVRTVVCRCLLSCASDSASLFDCRV